MMTGPQAMVLSGSIGKGHDVVAAVCSEALASAGLTPSTYDCMELLGHWERRLADVGFRWLLSRPALYDGFHFSYLRGAAAVSDRGDRAACGRIADALERDLGEQTELVLAVFASGVAAAGELARRHPGLKTAVFCTDATVHKMWVHEGIDLFVATCELAACTVRQYRPAAEVSVIPPPVRAPFYTAPERGQARDGLGVRESDPCVLLVAGGWGIAPLADFAARLVRSGYAVLAAAGSNRKLLRQLEALAADHPGLRAFGHTDRMPELMSASDVVVTGSGQTCHEVRVVGRPMVLVDVVPGHGRENLLHELCRGGALACPPEPDRVLGAVQQALKQPPPEPWPINSVEQWQQHFLAALQPLGLPS